MMLKHSEALLKASKAASEAWQNYLSPERAVGADDWWALTKAMQELVKVVAEVRKELVR